MRYTVKEKNFVEAADETCYRIRIDPTTGVYGGWLWVDQLDFNALSVGQEITATIERGEWRDSYPAIRLIEGKGMTGTTAEAYMEHIGYGSIPDEQAAANARLVAAAPEMAEALLATRRTVLDAGGTTPGLDEILKKAGVL